MLKIQKNEFFVIFNFFATDPASAKGIHSKIKNAQELNLALRCQTEKREYQRLRNIYITQGREAHRTEVMKSWFRQSNLAFLEKCKSNWWYRYL